MIRNLERVAYTERMANCSSALPLSKADAEQHYRCMTDLLERYHAATVSGDRQLTTATFSALCDELRWVHQQALPKQPLHFDMVLRRLDGWLHGRSAYVQQSELVSLPCAVATCDANGVDQFVGIGALR